MSIFQSDVAADFLIKGGANLHCGRSFFLHLHNQMVSFKQTRSYKTPFKYWYIANLKYIPKNSKSNGKL